MSGKEAEPLLLVLPGEKTFAKLAKRWAVQAVRTAKLELFFIFAELMSRVGAARFFRKFNYALLPHNTALRIKFRSVL